MGREIKFRGKRLDNGEWVYGNLIGSEVIVGEIVDWDDEYFCTSFWYKVNPQTVSQYTGLKDMNGKEIYEGDILQIPDLYETPENTSTTYHTAAVDFEEFGFRVDGSQLCEDYQYISDECEVVGNIYDNADLIAEV